MCQDRRTSRQALDIGDIGIVPTTPSIDFGLPGTFCEANELAYQTNTKGGTSLAAKVVWTTPKFARVLLPVCFIIRYGCNDFEMVWSGWYRLS